MTDLIIDGNSLWARAWFATQGTGDSSTAPVQAGLSTVLALLTADSERLGERVDRLLFGWDGPNTRDKHRDPKPGEYYVALETFLDCLDLMFSPAHALSDACEADDVVATAVQQSTSETIFVASGDKDLHQLASESVHIYSLNEKVLLSLRAIRDRWHVKQPEQIARALAVIGDKVDGIVGIKGWGPKKVQKLFEAVTPDMNLEQALDTLLAQIPEDRQPEFLTSLDLTLLNRGLPDIPAPAAIVPVDPVKVEGLKMVQVTAAYSRFHRQYVLRRLSVDGDGDEEDVP